MVSTPIKVCVVVRTLNEENNILHCLRSLQSQTLKPNEIIVADNGSTDNTVLLVQKQNMSNLRVIHVKKKGFVPGLNASIKESKSNHIAFLSADCIADKEWLFFLVQTMQTHECEIVQGNEIAYPENDIHFVLNIEATKPKADVKILYFNNTNTLFKKSFFDKAGEFKEIESLGAEDTMLSLELSNLNSIAFLSVGAIVKHRKFNNWKEFNDRMYKHGKLSIQLFYKYPLRPRLYLNAYYWSIKELYLFIKLRDIRILRMSINRTYFNILGSLSKLFHV